MFIFGTFVTDTGLIGLRLSRCQGQPVFGRIDCCQELSFPYVVTFAWSDTNYPAGDEDGDIRRGIG